MKRMLLAMDLSPLFERALQFAQEHDAAVTVAHVIDERILRYGDWGHNLAAIFTQRAEEKLKRHWPAPSKYPRLHLQLTITTGSPWFEILNLARAEGNDLLMLGLHRTNPLKDAFIGTTAERIIRHSNIPVLVVKDKPSGSYKKVMATTDFSPASSHAL